MRVLVILFTSRHNTACPRHARSRTTRSSQHVTVKCLYRGIIDEKAGMRSTMERLKLAIWLALMLTVQPAPARPELIFKVPEVHHEAVPRPASTRPTVGRGVGGVESNMTAADKLQAPTHYYIEHEISITEARKAAQILKLYQVSASLPGCGTCSHWELEYCSGGVVGDHCCCERRYMREPFPWLPHSCYLPTERCELKAHNCAHYTRIRDCCCNKVLAEKWKSILSKASQLSLSGMTFLVFALVLFSLYL